jgi:hypothetical protein
LTDRGCGLRSGTEEHNAKRQWNRRAKNSLQSFHRPLPDVGPSESSKSAEKSSLFADVGTVHRPLLRAIDTDVTLARRGANHSSVFTEEISPCVKKARTNKKHRARS